MITWDSVKSSNLKKVGFDPSENKKSGSVYITFLSGKTYKYADVPKSLYTRMLKASSVGSFFSNNIKGLFEESQVTLDEL